MKLSHTFGQILGLALLAAPVPSLALDKGAVLGKWSLDEARSKAAADGNTAGLMNELSIREDGTFEAMYGTKGKWTAAKGQVLVTYDNNPLRHDEAIEEDGDLLKFPSPAMKGRYCYMKRVGDAPAGASAGKGKGRKGKRR